MLFPTFPRRVFFLLSLALLTAVVPARADEVVLPAREAFHLFLLVGQSNMAGRGLLEAQDREPNERVLMLTQAGTWAPAVDPLHFDKPAAGVGLGKTFGEVIAQARPGVTVGLIPCAVGGSPIETWAPGVTDEATRTRPWDDMLRRARKALAAGTLKGILWHQGESDARPDRAPFYEARLHGLIDRLRTALDAGQVPFMAGQMGQWKERPWTPEHRVVDGVHQALPRAVARTGFVSAEGLHHKGDRVHFDAASYRELGRRYAKVYLEMEAK